MEKELTIEEVIKAIDKLKRNEPSGSDGIIAEFYKTFKNKFALHLLTLFRQCVEERNTSASWKEAKVLNNS